MSSIGTTTSATGAGAQAQPGSGGLQAQKAQCERQLADWVNCISAKTPEGKAKIAQYSDKLAAVNAQIKKADDARAQAQKAQEAQQAPAAATRRTPALQTTGSLIDTWA